MIVFQAGEVKSGMAEILYRVIKCIEDLENRSYRSYTTYRTYV